MTSELTSGSQQQGFIQSHYTPASISLPIFRIVGSQLTPRWSTQSLRKLAPWQLLRIVCSQGKPQRSYIVSYTRWLNPRVASCGQICSHFKSRTEDLMFVVYFSCVCSKYTKLDSLFLLYSCHLLLPFPSTSLYCLVLNKSLPRRIQNQKKRK